MLGPVISISELMISKQHFQYTHKLHFCTKSFAEIYMTIKLTVFLLTHLLSTACMKSLNSLKAVPSPHSPKRVM